MTDFFKFQNWQRLLRWRLEFPNGRNIVSGWNQDDIKCYQIDKSDLVKAYIEQRSSVRENQWVTTCFECDAKDYLEFRWLALSKMSWKIPGGKLPKVLVGIQLISRDNVFESHVDGKDFVNGKQVFDNRKIVAVSEHSIRFNNKH